MYIIFSHRFYILYANQKTIDIGINTDFAFFLLQIYLWGVAGGGKALLFCDHIFKEQPRQCWPNDPLVQSVALSVPNNTSVTRQRLIVNKFPTKS